MMVVIRTDWRFVLTAHSITCMPSLSETLLVNFVSSLDWAFSLMCKWQDDISKKQFRPGGMAPSEWTHSVRAIRDTPVADYPAPGANTTHRVVYRPLIAVSPFPLALSASYCKRTLRRCGQLCSSIIFVFVTVTRFATS